MTQSAPTPHVVQLPTRRTPYQYDAPILTYPQLLTLECKINMPAGNFYKNNKRAPWKIKAQKCAYRNLKNIIV